MHQDSVQQGDDVSKEFDSNFHDSDYDIEGDDDDIFVEYVDDDVINETNSKLQQKGKGKKDVGSKLKGRKVSSMDFYGEELKGPNMARGGGVNSLFKNSTKSLEQEVSK